MPTSFLETFSDRSLQSRASAYALGLRLGLILALGGCSSNSDHVPNDRADAGQPIGDAHVPDALDGRVALDSTTPSTTQDGATAYDAALGDAAGPLGLDAASSGPVARMVAGVDVHNYPKPSAYGYVDADGGDRVGAALTYLSAPPVRGASVGDTDFLMRLASFGVKEVILTLSATDYGKPFDPAQLTTALAKSLAAAKTAGITIQVEGLNEWDLFNTRSYNDGCEPAGVSASQFILFTQKALYEAAHPLGLTVLGPSVGHPTEAQSLAFFPDVSAYVDVVNVHLYYGTKPETLPLETVVSTHRKIQGAGKPLWITETGVSAVGAVTLAIQGDVIKRGLAFFSNSGLVDRAYHYDLLDDNQAGLVGTTFIADSDQIHFGLFTYAGAPKPAADAVRAYIATP